MKHLYPLHGIVTVLNTPFTNDNKIDLAALKRNVNEALYAGVAGFLIPAMAPEISKLSEAERLSEVVVVMEIVNGKVPVIAGAGESYLSKSKKMLKLYIQNGCKNVLFQIPIQNKEQFKNHFMQLADMGPEMIMLQDWDSSGIRFTR